MGRAIGIDLGNTNSVMAVKVGNDITILQNRENEDLTPSVVACFKGQILVGSPAVDRMLLTPKDTIISIKRLIGRAYSDPEVQKNKEKHPL